MCSELETQLSDPLTQGQDGAGVREQGPVPCHRCVMVQGLIKALDLDSSSPQNSFLEEKINGLDRFPQRTATKIFLRCPSCQPFVPRLWVKTAPLQH